MRHLTPLLALISLVIFATACDKDAPKPDIDPAPVGGDCSSIGGEPCECPDGTKHCTDFKGVCPCDAPEEPKPSAGTIMFPTSALACDDSGARAVDTWLAAHFDWSSHTLEVQGDDELVELDQASAEVDADPFLMFVGPDVTRFQGKRLAADSDLPDAHAEAVGRKKREAKILGTEWAHPGVVVSFARDTPWERVVWAFDALGKLRRLEADALYLGFLHPRPTELGAPSPALQKEMSDHFAFPNPTKSPRHSSATADCEAMSKLYNALEKLPPAAKRTTLEERLGSTWVTCECKPDIEWLVGLQAMTFGQPLTLVPVELGDETSVSHAATASWQDTYESLVAPEGSVNVQVAP